MYNSVADFYLFNQFLGHLCYSLLSGFNTSDTSINISWTHIPENLLDDTQRGYEVKVKSLREYNSSLVKLS